MSDDVIVGFDVRARLHVDVDARQITHMAIDPRPAPPCHLGGPAEHLPQAIALCAPFAWPANPGPPAPTGVNERRADLGRAAVSAARQTDVESAATAVVDVLAYIAHFCDRLGLDPNAAFEDGLRCYEGDAEDGPPAQTSLDARAPLQAGS